MQPEKQAFVEQKRIAVVGVSKSGKGFGSYALKALRKRGYEVYPVNIDADEIEGEKCYRRLDDIPQKPDAVVTVVPPERTADVVADCARVGIGKVWMQQGSESEQAIALCKEKGISEVHGACILMHARPEGMHKFHGWIWNLLGK
ncbi:MAG: CoA-binding protein [Myxococcales bacterium]